MSEIVQLTNLQLTPVMEFEPFDYKDESRQSPTGDWTDEVANAYWHGSLSDAGLSHLRSITTRSWHVAIVQLSRSDLDIALTRKLKQYGREAFDEESCIAFAGGLALFARELASPIEPECCGDLSDHTGWLDAAAYRSEQWNTLWIGHPWLSVQYINNRLILSEPHEDNTPQGKWSIDPNELELALAPAIDQLQLLCDTVENALESLPCVGNRKTIAKILAGFISV